MPDATVDAPSGEDADSERACHGLGGSIYHPGGMECPHCQHAIHASWQQYGRSLGRSDPDVDHWDLEALECPECGRLVVRLRAWSRTNHNYTNPMIYPKVRIRAIPEQVTGEYREDFQQACAVLDISPKASAALSRRLVQHILREKAGVHERTLDKEIEKVLAAGQLPTDLAEDLDALRNLGNLATHPIKSEESGVIVPVEPGEAEWLLDLVEELLDFYFVRPAVRETKRAKLNQKLAEAGKPPLREGDSQD
jgi:Domain of unknown function (DUF4145)